LRPESSEKSLTALCDFSNNHNGVVLALEKYYLT